MAGWNNVEQLLQQTAEHSTLIGKYWVTVFLVVRLLIVWKVADGTWKESQKTFVCNTESPGCKSVCFNEYSPVALDRYWFLQLASVALPSVIFIVYTAHKLNKITAAKEKMKKKDGEPEKSKKDTEKLPVAKLEDDMPSKLFLAYYMTVVMRIVVDVTFVIGQYHFYTFGYAMPELFQCRHWPCPAVVDCWVSRPKEKTVFIAVWYASCCVSVLINIVDLCQLSGRLPEAWRTRGDDITKKVGEGPQFGFGRMRGDGFVPGYPEVYPDVVATPDLRQNRHRRRY